MKIILTEAVEKLGQVGEVKEVANGYARNFLFPRGFAIPATRGALLEATNRRTSSERRVANQLSATQAAADRLRDLSVLLYARTGEQNRLYGAITPADVAEALRVQHNQTVDRRRIKLNSTIHRTGRYTATLTLGNNISVPLTLVVEPETSRTTGALTTVAANAPAPPPAPVQPTPVPAAMGDEITSDDMTAPAPVPVAMGDLTTSDDVTLTGDLEASENAATIGSTIAADAPTVTSDETAVEAVPQMPFMISAEDVEHGQATAEGTGINVGGTDAPATADSTTFTPNTTGDDTGT